MLDDSYVTGINLLGSMTWTKKLLQFTNCQSSSDSPSIPVFLSLLSFIYIDMYDLV